jgi:hypothetical protein
VAERAGVDHGLVARERVQRGRRAGL